jgi:hypothetical protein
MSKHPESRGEMRGKAYVSEDFGALCVIEQFFRTSVLWIASYDSKKLRSSWFSIRSAWDYHK